MTKKRAAREGYRVIRGIGWPDVASPGKEKSAEPGEVRSDLPAEYVAEWLGVGAIEPADMTETSGDSDPAAEEA